MPANYNNCPNLTVFLICLNRYFYLTMIREPLHRFLSEFRHVQRGATWKASRHSCDGRLATAQVRNFFTAVVRNHYYRNTRFPHSTTIPLVRTPLNKIQRNMD